MHPDGALHMAVGHGFPQDTSFRPKLPSDRKWRLGLQVNFMIYL